MHTSSASDKFLSLQHRGFGERNTGYDCFVLQFLAGCYKLNEGVEQAGVLQESCLHLQGALRSLYSQRIFLSVCKTHLHLK